MSCETETTGAWVVRSQVWILRLGFLESNEGPKVAYVSYPRLKRALDVAPISFILCSLFLSRLRVLSYHVSGYAACTHYQLRTLPWGQDRVPSPFPSPPPTPVNHRSNARLRTQSVDEGLVVSALPQNACGVYRINTAVHSRSLFLRTYLPGTNNARRVYAITAARM